MAVAFDAYSRHADGFTSSLSWSHTCAGADRYLAVFISIRSSQDRVSGIAYNGSAMTRLEYTNNGALGVYLYGVAAPASGAHNVVATLTTSVAADSAAMSFPGVDQTTPTNDIDSNINGFKNSPAQLSLTTLTGGMGLSFVSSSDDKSNTYSPESGQTQAGQSDSTLDLVAAGYKANAATVGWTWTGGNSKNMGHIAAAINAVASTDFNLVASPLALSASMAITGDVQFVGGSAFEIEPPLAVVPMSAALGITGDFQFVAGAFNLVASPIALAASMGITGDVQVSSAILFDVVAAPIAITASMGVAGDFQFSDAPAYPTIVFRGDPGNNIAIDNGSTAILANGQFAIVI